MDSVYLATSSSAVMSYIKKKKNEATRANWKAQPTVHIEKYLLIEVPDYTRKNELLRLKPTIAKMRIQLLDT